MSEGRPIDNILKYPEELRSRFRGRSVPSPQARKVKEPEAPIVLENHIITGNYKFEDIGQTLILIATSQLILQKWQLAVHAMEKEKKFSLIAKTEKFIQTLDFGNVQVGISAAEVELKIDEFVLETGQELFIQSDGPADITLTLEFLRHARTIG